MDVEKKFTDQIVNRVILLNSLFAAAVLAVFLITRSEPTTLVACWFGSFTGELLIMGGIKITKTKQASAPPQDQQGPL